MRITKLFLPIIFGLTITFALFGVLALPFGTLAAPDAPTATILYVDADATGSASGADWTDAYTTVQDALAVAASGDEIWVAAGVYYPDQGDGQTNDDRDSSFALSDGLAIYGGFDPDAGADQFDERDWETYITVLSGDIDADTGGADSTDSHGVVTTTANITGTNAYHVLSSSGLTAATVIDGFSVTAGQADGSYPDNSGGGMLNGFPGSSPTLKNMIFSGNLADGGGGICNMSYSSPTLINVTLSSNSAGEGGGMSNLYNSSPALTNVIFSGNSAENGGGMLNKDHSSPTLTEVTFLDNTAVSFGGGMRNTDSSSPVLTDATFFGNSAEDGGGIANGTSSSPELTDATFYGNVVAGDGAGIFSEDGSSPALTNAIFSGNSAENGGALYSTHNSKLTLMNVTIAGNLATNYGAGLYNNNGSNLTLGNTVMWGNTAYSSALQMDNTSSTPSISFSDIQGCGGSTSWKTACGTDGGNNIDADPLFRQTPDPGPDGNWDGVDDDYGDLHLQTGSPAVDSGTNSGCPAADLDGNARPFGTACDMGAYEFGAFFSKSVDDSMPIPGQTITFTIVMANQAADVTGGLILDTLPIGLNFIPASITLNPTGAGLAGTTPPELASNLVVPNGESVTVTTAVTVSYGLAAGTELVNTAAFSSSEITIPMLATTTVTVQNVAPVANPDEGTDFSTGQKSLLLTASVLDNDSDLNGDTLSVQSFDATGTMGVIIDIGDGTFGYDPDGQFDHLAPGETASDTFTYTVSDGHGGTDTATVTITIMGELYIFLPQVAR